MLYFRDPKLERQGRSVQVVYGTAVSPANSGFSPLAPLAAGLAIYVAEEAGGPYTGSPLNPARLIGPALVFFCNWRHFWAWLSGGSALLSSACNPADTLLYCLYGARMIGSEGPYDGATQAFGLPRAYSSWCAITKCGAKPQCVVARGCRIYIRRTQHP